MSTSSFASAIKAGSSHATTVRQQMRNYPDQLIDRTNGLLKQANRQLADLGHDGGLIVIFDNLDRYEPEQMDRLEDYWGIGECELDMEIDEDYVMDRWLLHDGPAAQAYYLLDSLDLGNALRGPGAVGGIDFMEESNMVWTWRYATPKDEVSLSLLQQRLNDLGTGIRVVTG